MTLSEETMDTTSICKFCQQLNLRSLFSNVGASMPVGTRYEKPLQSDCKLCHLFHEYTPSMPHKTGCSCMDESKHLVVMPAESSCDFVVKMFKGNNDTMGEPVSLVLLPSCTQLKPLAKLDYLQRDALRVLALEKGLILAAENGQPPFPFTLVPKLLEYSTYQHLKNCIDECITNHQRCRYSVQQKPIETNLIDCEARCIISGKIVGPYVALSYVWGTILSSPISDGRLSIDLPKVIDDAIYVTKTLGFRYLWVDQYCIEQNNKEKKFDQIQSMDEIYKRAELTIVAAAGSDAEYGLPGIKIHLRTPKREFLQLKDITLLSTTVHPSRTITSSAWMTRGWTYQEAFFSRRLLVFTDEQIYYQCSQISRCETLELEIERHFAPATFLTNSPILSSRVESGLLLSEFMYHVEQYSARSLTFEEDSLLAFAGILKTFEALGVEETQNTNVVGVDGEQLSKSFTPEPTQINQALGIVYSNKEHRFRSTWGIPFHLPPKGHTPFDLGTLAIIGISWYHKDSSCDGPQSKYEQPARRPSFPSWSWAGWSGAVVYPWKGDLSVMLSPKSLIAQVRNFRFLNAEGWRDTKTSTQTATVFENGSTQSRILSFEGSSIPANKISLRKKSNGHLEWSICGFEAKIYMSKRLPNPDMFSSSISKGIYEAVYLYRKTSIPRYLVVLILQHGSATERVGFMLIQDNGDATSLREFHSMLLEPVEYQIN